MLRGEGSPLRSVLYLHLLFSSSPSMLRKVRTPATHVNCSYVRIYILLKLLRSLMQCSPKPRLRSRIFIYDLCLNKKVLTAFNAAQSPNPGYAYYCSLERTYILLPSLRSLMKCSPKPRFRSRIFIYDLCICRMKIILHL